MKLATILLNDQEHVAVVQDDLDGAVLLKDLYDHNGLGQAPESMRALLAKGEEELQKVRGLLADSTDLVIRNLNEATWKPPIPEPSKVLGVAMNNRRLNDTAHVTPAGPMFFVKPSNTLVGHKGTVEIADDYGFTFPELELAIVIGAPTRHVSEEEALSHVAGYTIVNDITSQGLKAGDSIATEIASDVRSSPGYDSYFSWRRVNEPDANSVYLTYHTRSKGADTFAPMGPYITTRDEINNPDDLAIRGYADGELFTEDSTSSYSYSVPKIISWASRYFTLNPGDIIMCGTAARGVGRYPRAHHDVDLSSTTPDIKIEIEGLGELYNSVRHIMHPVH